MQLCGEYRYQGCTEAAARLHILLLWGRCGSGGEEGTACTIFTLPMMTGYPRPEDTIRERTAESLRKIQESCSECRGGRLDTDCPAKTCCNLRLDEKFP